MRLPPRVGAWVRAGGGAAWRRGRKLAGRLQLRRRPPGPRPRDWGIGIYAGDSPFTLAPLQAARHPALTWTDVSPASSGIIADPFMLRRDGIWYMFFEVMNRPQGRGEIGLATSPDGAEWRYRQIVLAEPFHLSYPYVFEWDNEVFMIPESHQARTVRLYRASPFPLRWSLVSSLLEGADFSDSSIVRRDGRWWLFSETSQGTFDTLRLYSSENLLGAWREHPRSPIVRDDPRRARPAGRVVVLGDRVVRFAQDCRPVYGSAVRAFEVTELTATRYAEREAADRPVLAGAGAGWNASGMHHIDAHQMADGTWLACVDGWAWPGERRA